MTHAQAYAALVNVDQQLDVLCTAAELRQLSAREDRRYDALMEQWANLSDVIDPEQKIDYLGDIAVFAPPAPAGSTAQMEMFS